MLKQSVALSGICNARELGGYTVGDRTIRKGILLRTAGLNNAAPEAIEKLKNEYRVQSVIDFRMTDERLSIPDPEIPCARNVHLSVVEIEDYAADNQELVEAYRKCTDKMQVFELSYEAGMLGPSQYLNFLLGERGKNAYRQFFRILLETDPDNGAVLWHCTDGKDRTGCAAMLLLSALGADRETIIADYMLSNEYNAARIEAIKQKTAAFQMPQDKFDALMFISGAVVEGYMTNAIDTLNERYGSVEGYLKDEMNVGTDEIGTLRKKYLEEARI